MSVKIRLARRGRKKRPFYHIVVADSRSPRDGSFIEKIGSYNPMTTPATIELDMDRAFDWLINGAQPTYTAKAILRFKGVLYKKHLQRGVTKGALTQEEADAKLKEWLASKDSRIEARIRKVEEEKEKMRKMIAGEITEVKAGSADDETREAFREDAGSPEEVVEAVSEDLQEITTEEGGSDQTVTEEE